MRCPPSFIHTLFQIDIVLPNHIDTHNICMAAAAVGDDTDA